MSRNDVEAEIQLEEGVLEPGGRATVRVRLNVRSPVKIRGAHAHLRGYEETKAVYTTSNGKTTTTHTATERNALVEGGKTFQGRAAAGFFANLADGAMTLLGGGDHEELPQGSHDVLLEVDLPPDLPEAFEAKKIKVAYEATVHLDIPAGSDFRCTRAFPVQTADAVGAPEQQPASIRYPEDSDKGFFDSMFGPDVFMVVDLDSDVVARGDVVSGTLEVRFPDRPPKVRAVVCRLQRREKSKAQGHSDGHTENLAEQSLPQREATSNSLFVPFAVRVPDDAIPNCTGAKFTLWNELAVSLDVPWAKDPTIRIPIDVV